MDVLSRCACGGAPALYAPDVKSETKYAASVVCHHCGVSMQMANHDSDPKRVVAAWNRAHPHRINTMTVNEKGLEAAQVAAREGCGLFIESQHVFCDDPVVGEAADGYGKPLRQPYCSCKGDAERIIEAYLRASSNDAEPVEILLETAWLTDHLPPNAAGLKLYRYDSKDRLIGCESVLFVDGFPAVETTLRRARIAGRAEVGGDIDKHFADVLDKDGDWIGASVALDRASYSALKNRWMRCKTEDLDNVLGRRTRSKQRSDKE